MNLEVGGGGILTEEVEDEAAVGEAAGWSAEESTAVGGVDGEAKSSDKSTGVRVGVPKVEDDGPRIALAIDGGWENNQKDGAEERESETQWLSARHTFLLYKMHKSKFFNHFTLHYWRVCVFSLYVSHSICVSVCLSVWVLI